MPQRQQVETTQGLLNYDYLIVALGADQHPETVPGQIEAAFNPYNLQDACRLQQELQFLNLAESLSLLPLYLIQVLMVPTNSSACLTPIFVSAVCETRFS